MDSFARILALAALSNEGGGGGGGDIEIASDTVIGGITAKEKTPDQTVEVGIDRTTGRLFVSPTAVFEGVPCAEGSEF